MKFVSPEYICFLLASWTVFLVVPARYRWIVLLAASYIFYATWSIPFVAMILLTTSIDYFASLWIHKNPPGSMRKSVLCSAIFANLLVLGFFKYFNFFLDVQFNLLGALSLHSPLPQHLNILLPIGISYYSFEAIAYVVDVYRGAKPAPNWWSYNLYIMYFPHLLSGPIIRFKELFNQYGNPIAVPSVERIGKAVELLMLGYFFKVVIADSCALTADPVFADAAKASTLSIYTAALAFTTQIYMDFLGYTHIARGTSLLFNIELPFNFDHPLHSTNMSNFWQRWQITLAKWLHDYVYRPLGGSSKSLWKTMRNVFITLLIAGIWHGAGWTYLVLGVYFGAVVAGYHAYRRLRKNVLKDRDRALVENRFYKHITHAITFALIVFSAVLFRSPSVQTDWIFLNQLLRVPSLVKEVGGQFSRGNLVEIGVCAVLMVILLGGPLAVEMYGRLFRPMPYWVKAQAVTVVVVLCWILCGTETPPFIYFQF